MDSWSYLPNTLVRDTWWVRWEATDRSTLVKDI